MARMLVLVFGAVVTALMLFAGVVMLGSWLVRRLDLPQDLPATILMEPPPPPLLVRPDREAARHIAATQEQQRAPFLEGRRLWLLGETIRQAAMRWQAIEAGDEEASDQSAACQQACHGIDAAMTALEEAFRSRNGSRLEAVCRDQGPTIVAAHADCAAAIDALPPISNRRLWLMLTALLLAVLAQIALLWCLGDTPP